MCGRVQMAKVHLLLCLLLLHSCSHSRLCPPHQKHPFVGTQNISAFHILLSARFPQDISYKLHRIQFLTQICVHLCQLCNGSASRSCSSVHKSNGRALALQLPSRGSFETVPLWAELNIKVPEPGFRSKCDSCKMTF